MLTAYRRHSQDCQFKLRGQRKCKCPVWVDGTFQGKDIRQSLKTRSWEEAQRKIRTWEEAGVPSAISLKEALDKFMDFLKGRNLRVPSLYKFELLEKELNRRFSGRLDSISVTDLREYQSSWKMCPQSRANKLARVKRIFRWFHDNGWIQVNGAKNLEPPIFTKKPAVPFSADEMEKVLWATEVYPDNPKGRQKQVRAFVLVLRYTGLRIGDAVALRKESIQDGKLCLRTAKTGTQVWIPLKDEVKEVLSELSTIGGYFFWSGKGTLKSAVSSWHRSIATLFRLAGVKGHPHQFRHYFSVDLLSKGVAIEDVAALLGHSSSLITARYYNAFVTIRQKRLEQAIEKAWSS